MRPKILITCEHADYKIPDFIKSKIPVEFRNLKNKHQAYDKGALEASLKMQIRLKKLGHSVELITYPYTRLIIDANRTPKNKGFFSKLSTSLTDKELTKTHKVYDNYVKKCMDWIGKNDNRSPLYIFSIHSFTPVYKDKPRKTDLGVLYRNKNLKELALARKFTKELKIRFPNHKIHKNLPYRGFTDCFLNSILDSQPKTNGLFLEFNQDFLKGDLNSKIYKVAESIHKTVML